MKNFFQQIRSKQIFCIILILLPFRVTMNRVNNRSTQFKASVCMLWDLLWPNNWKFSKNLQIINKHSKMFCFAMRHIRLKYLFSSYTMRHGSAFYLSASLCMIKQIFLRSLTKPTCVSHCIKKAYVTRRLVKWLHAYFQ